MALSPRAHIQQAVDGGLELLRREAATVLAALRRREALHLRGMLLAVARTADRHISTVGRLT